MSEAAKERNHPDACLLLAQQPPLVIVYMTVTTHCIDAMSLGT